VLHRSSPLPFAKKLAPSYLLLLYLFTHTRLPKSKEDLSSSLSLETLSSSGFSVFSQDSRQRILRISCSESLVGFHFFLVLLPSFYLLKFLLLDFVLTVPLFLYLWLPGNATALFLFLAPVYVSLRTTSLSLSL
jgi:hypothetical protein